MSKKRTEKNNDIKYKINLKSTMEPVRQRNNSLPVIIGYDWSYFDLERILKDDPMENIQSNIETLLKNNPNIEPEELIRMANADNTNELMKKNIDNKKTQENKKLMQFANLPNKKSSYFEMFLYNKSRIKDNNGDFFSQFLLQKIPSAWIKSFNDLLKSFKFDLEILDILRDKLSFKDGFSRSQLAIWKGATRDKLLTQALAGIIEIVHYSLMLNWSEDTFELMDLIPYGINKEKELIDEILMINPSAKEFDKWLFKPATVESRPVFFPFAGNKSLLNYMEKNKLINTAALENNNIKDINRKCTFYHNKMMNESSISSKIFFAISSDSVFEKMFVDTRRYIDDYSFADDYERMIISDDYKKRFMETTFRNVKNTVIWMDSQKKFKKSCKMLKSFEKTINESYDKITTKEWEVLYHFFAINSPLTSLSSACYMHAKINDKELEKFDLRKILRWAFKAEIHYFEDINRFEFKDFVRWLHFVCYKK